MKKYICILLLVSYAFGICIANEREAGVLKPTNQDDIQIVNSTLLRNRYPAITVRQGIPVRWIINAPQGSINGCNNRMIIGEYNIRHTFKQGDNVIEFTPQKTGKFNYSCWMGMIRSSITVVADDENADVQKPGINLLQKKD